MDEGPYETDTTKETDMTEQAAAPTLKDTIIIDSGDDNDNNDKDKEDNNALHPRTVRKQGCENRTEEPLFSDDSDDDHNDNYHDNNYSESSDDDNMKKKRPRRTPKSIFRTPKKTHWSGNPLPAAQEAATVLVVIGANPNVSKFMVADGLDEITEIQELTRETISLYAKNSRKNLSGSDIISTQFIIDLKKAEFKMKHINNRISRVIDPVYIDKKWCRSMNYQFDLEQDWKNKPLKDLYTTQAHQMLHNVLRMICDANGVPLNAVICKRIVLRPDSDDIAFGLQHSEYASHDDAIIERAPIINHETFDRNTTDKDLEKTGPFDPHYLAARSLVWTVMKVCIGTNNKLNIHLK